MDKLHSRLDIVEEERRTSWEPAMKLSAFLALFPGAAGLLLAAPFDYHSVRGREAKGPVNGVLEGEFFPKTGKSRSQGMTSFGPEWSNNAHLLWDGEIGQSMTTEFRIEEAGLYQVSAQLTIAPDYGIFSLSLDGRVLKRGIDLYGPKVTLAPKVELGRMALTRGLHTLEFKLTGANPKASMFQNADST